MVPSEIFSTEQYRNVEIVLAEFLNSLPDFLSVRTAQSPRAAGDAIQEVITESFPTLVGDLGVEYSTQFARRSMADLAFTDKQGFYYMVDVKTHRVGTQFNMPNLTSVERLTRFYEDDKNYFVLLTARYSVEDIRVQVEEVHFIPIEFLHWNCLTIGALGWGQIQIANANILNIRPGYSRKQWMLELCDAMMAFYPKEAEKIARRMEHFKRVREKWEEKPDS